ncbi:efflux RND transporter periplasmic adaptor subunit [Pelagicoccus sp. SDUM812002]|uniref:efflux RND transporter periplasmic adaptor subunit n=1 Tax=Pelagicoccus sp. SDUM812002 TaxID=3041266 RepID=UPI00280F61D1|nr:efflux RND transporter periplasmic adaptor subunit [Pelagicoccus sp. SDUM812002]MDQ8185332.1 efflux RND transporter periplasmic adaptor subunit [Pelagicoccus sp. SDUM812002]
MKKRYWISALVIIGLGIAGASKFKKGDQITEVTVEKVQVGDITSVVTATGKVFPEIEVTISSEVAGEIVELPIQDGQLVEKGDLLVSVNPDRLEAQVLQQEAALRASKSNSLESKARMLQAELDLNRQKNLFDKGFSTQEQRDEAETSLEISQASYQATLSRIEQQEMQLKEARDSLAKATTFAPISGTITSLSSELGDRVVGTGQFEGTEIMSVADLSQMEIRVDVSESDIVQVKIGDPATIEIEAIPNEEYKGEVTEIANSASGGENSNDQLTTFLVKVRLIDPSAKIRPGMTATADIKTQTVKDVVKIPLQAVTVRSKDEVAKQLQESSVGTDTPAKPDMTRGENGNREAGPRKRDNLERVVFLYNDDNTVTLLRVETGLADNRSIEIKSGVTEGQQIVTGGYRVLTRELENGKTVKIADNKKDAKFKMPSK